MSPTLVNLDLSKAPLARSRKDEPICSFFLVKPVCVTLTLTLTLPLAILLVGSYRNRAGRKHSMNLRSFWGV